ncbi:MAG TPA: hypothetical protein VE224_04420, partial [Pseudolabrys sp.]|nr:hypothetical protein [Pseudolabrys sp.]
MRGDDEICGSLFSYIDLEDRIRAEHPLRPIRAIANAALATLSGDFAALRRNHTRVAAADGCVVNGRGMGAAAPAV